MIKIPHQLTTNVKLLQKVVLLHQGAALLLKRAADSGSRPEKWDLAGGNSEWPGLGQAGSGLHRLDLAREVKEETNLTIDPNQLNLDQLVFFDTFFDETKQIFSIICGWQYHLPDDFRREQVKISSEHTDLAWARLDDLAHFDFGGPKGEFVKRMIEQALA